MKRYSEYKDSGVKWIGEIPGHWETPKLNRLVTKVGSGSTPTGGASVYVPEGIKFIRSQNVYFEGFLLEDVAHISRDIHNKMRGTWVHSGDVLINITGGSIGRCINVDDSLGEANVNQHVCIIRPKMIESKYLKLFLQSYAGQSQVMFYQKGDREGLSAESLKAFRITYPPLPEQQAIVAYLDRKVAQIDQYIAMSEQKMKALDELKQTIIADAVTHGINPNAKMKDSGVKWIGRVPEDWEVVRLKHKYSFKTGATPSTGKEEYFDGDVKWANISDLNQRVIYDTAKHISEKAASKCCMTISPKGSLMYSFKLSVGNVAFCGDDMYTNEAIATFEKGENSLEYLYYIAPVFIIHNAKRNIYNAALLNQELIKNALICFPPLPEQRAIVAYLDDKVAKIDQLRDKQQAQIDKLREYKQRLISDVVTGKVCVTQD